MTWHPANRPARMIALVVGALFGSYFGLYGAAILMRQEAFRFGDFFALWSYGQVLAAHPASELYDFASLVARQEALGMPATQSNPFPYPPSFLPAVWPLGFVSYEMGYAGFMGATLALYLLAIGLAAPPPRLPVVLVALVAPTSILTLVAGQSGFLAAALFLGGLRLAPVRPILAGVLLGLLAYKPQLGVLVPLALLAAGMWRVIVAAVVTVAAVALATSAAFGWHVWADWLAYLPTYATQFEHESGGNAFLMPTITAALGAMGVPPAIVHPMQAIVALAAAVWVWRSFRGGGFRAATMPRLALVLATATFLATPHAFIYDLPVLTGAIVLFIAARVRALAGLTAMEVAVLLLALVFPAVMVHQVAPVALGAACLALLAATLIVIPSIRDAGTAAS